jgi:hypothetical protein
MLKGKPEPEAAVVVSPKSRLHEAITPSESELVEPLKVTLSGALPLAGDGADVMRAIGATFAFDVTAIVFGAEVAPSLSVTVNEAVYDPAAYEWVAVLTGGAPLPEVEAPSPKASDHEAIVPSVSELVDALKVTLSGAFPVAEDGVVVIRAVGGAFTSTAVESVSVDPLLSVTVKTAVKLPAAYVWVAVLTSGAPVPVAAALPSPKLSDHEAIVPSESVLVEPLKVTLRGAFPVDGAALRCATGGTFAFDVTVTVSVSVAPRLSVTVRVAVLVPTAYG